MVLQGRDVSRRNLSVIERGVEMGVERAVERAVERGVERCVERGEPTTNNLLYN